MSANDRDKCLGEVKLLQSFNHPSIINYFDSFIQDNQLYIAIEWADKGDFKKLLTKHKKEGEHLEEAKIVEYLRSLASALQHMHERRIIHRDLKPANILYFSEGVKVGDLGLGRILSEETLMIYSAVGTPLYMSPEVCRNINIKIF